MSEKPKQKYRPSPGGRIEIRFLEKDDKDLSDALIKNIKIKTGLKPDKIMILALNELNKKYDSRGNLI
jgi:hypothetical protein